MGEADEHQDDHTAEQESKAGDHRAPELGHFFLSHDPVNGKQDGGRQGQHHAEGVQTGLKGVDDGHGPQHLQHQSGDVAAPDGLAQEQKCQEGDEHRVAAEQDGHYPGVHVVHRQLINRHTDGDAHQAQQGEIGHAFPVQRQPPLFQRPPGQRGQEQKADEEAGEGELDGVDLPRDILQGHLKSAEHDGGDGNKDVPLFHIRSPFLSSVGSGRTATRPARRQS